MMAMTTSNSIKVKARCIVFPGETLPQQPWLDAFDFKFQWTTNSSKHIPFDWVGP